MSTARVGGPGLRPLNAWQCFFVGYTWLYKGVTFVFLLSFPLSLPFDWTLRCWVCVCCFVCLYFGWYVCYVWKEKKTVDNKKMRTLESAHSTLGQHSSHRCDAFALQIRTPKCVQNFGTQLTQDIGPPGPSLDPCFTVSVITVLVILDLRSDLFVRNILGYLIKSIALNRPVCFVSLVQFPFSEHISPARVRCAAWGSHCSVVY